MQWGIRLFLVVVGLVLLAIVVGVLWAIVRPVLTEGRRAAAAGDWWLPFLPREDGRWGPLAQNHWWSAMRAERPGSSAGLAVRWGFWGLMSVLLVIASVMIVVDATRLLASGW